jgi:hypothetical protein
MRDRTPERLPRDDDFAEGASEKESFLRDVSLDHDGSSSSAGSDTPRATKFLQAPLEMTAAKKGGQKAGKVVRWRDLPRKGQLTVLTLARLSEPLVQTSIQVRLPRGNANACPSPPLACRQTVGESIGPGADGRSRTCFTSSSG